MPPPTEPRATHNLHVAHMQPLASPRQLKDQLPLDDRSKETGVRGREAIQAILSGRALAAAHQPHRFLGINEDGMTCIVVTKGNPWGHVILRGGREAPNYSSQMVGEAVTQLEAAGLPARIVVDCSHSNSERRHERQSLVWSSVIEQRAAGNRALSGAMLESNLVEGRQELAPTPLRYGVSITDACIGWDETEQLLRQAWERLA